MIEQFLKILGIFRITYLLASFMNMYHKHIYLFYSISLFYLISIQNTGSYYIVWRPRIIITVGIILIQHKYVFKHFTELEFDIKIDNILKKYANMNSEHQLCCLKSVNIINRLKLYFFRVLVKIKLLYF